MGETRVVVPVDERRVREMIAAAQLRPMGCICPPTSERTCGNVICPRKPIVTTFPRAASEASS